MRSVLDLIDMLARLEHRPQDRLYRLGVFLGELFGESEHLFRMVFPYLLRGDRRKTDAIGDGARVPRLADAKAVHFAYLHIRHHLRRWNGDQGNILIGVDTAGSQPIAGPHGMGTWRKGHGKSHGTSFGLGL